MVYCLLVHPQHLIQVLEELGGSGLDEALDPLGGPLPAAGVTDHAVAVARPAVDVVPHDGVGLVVGGLVEVHQVGVGLLGGVVGKSLSHGEGLGVTP